MSEYQKRFNLDSFIPKGNQLAGYLEALYEAKDNQSLPNEYYYVITLLEMYLFANVTFVQCFAYDKAYGRAKSDWERSICLSLFDIVIGEGITYLCGYDKETPKGTKYAKIKQNMPDGKYKKNILILCDEFTSYAKEFGLFVGLQNDKNITKHYDSDYLEIAHHLTHIHSDKRYKRNNTFLLLLSNLTDCIAEYIEKEQVIIPINEGVVSCDDSRTLLLETMLMKDSSSMERISKQISQDENCMSCLIELENFNQYISKLQRCGMLSEASSQSIKSQMQNYLNITTIIFHIRKVHLDINYAIRSYFESTEHLERQANVYRMIMALYGGYSQLYGVSKYGRSSLLGKLHKPINDCRDNDLLTDVRSIKMKLNAFQSTVHKYEEKRNYMTHNKDGKKDKILEKYYYLCTLSPTEIVTDCNQFLDITQPLIRITDDILKCYYPLVWKSFNESKR